MEISIHLCSTRLACLAILLSILPCMLFVTSWGCASGTSRLQRVSSGIALGSCILADVARGSDLGISILTDVARGSASSSSRLQAWPLPMLGMPDLDTIKRDAKILFEYDTEPTQMPLVVSFMYHGSNISMDHGLI